MTQTDARPAQRSQDAAAGGAVLELRGISKFFGGVRALTDVDLTLRAGEITSIVGDNGAGKSTLVKLLSGINAPTAGEVIFEGQPVTLHSPHDASALGIQTVYQDLALCDNLDTVQNLFLGREMVAARIPGARLSRPAMEQRANEVLSALAVKIRSLTIPVGRLSGGQRQSIAVCRSTLTEPKVVLLDEPTAALGVAQRAQVNGLIRRLREQRRAVGLISHELHDVRELSDRVVVLRLGHKVAEFTRGNYTGEDLVAAITGVAGAASEDVA